MDSNDLPPIPELSDPEGPVDLDDPRLAPSPVVAVVFDLGNVLIAWDPHPAVAAEVGEERATAFLQHQQFDFAAWNREQDSGRSFADAEAHAVERHPELEEEIRAYRKHFDKSILGAIDGTVGILRELHEADIPLFALTNWSAETFGIAEEQFDFLDWFNDIVVSGEEGVAKPDPKIFGVLEGCLEHLGGLDECVFIDDSEDNVTAAVHAGLDGIHFTGPQDLRLDLLARGLPVAAH